MQLFTKNVIEVIQSIPEGNVMTYGQVAKLSGSPRAARQVARILHSMSKKYQLPWHRVVNAQGEIRIKKESLYQIQRLSLEAEGIVFDEHGRIDLQLYQFVKNESAENMRQ